MKYVAALEQRLRHLRRPRMFVAHPKSKEDLPSGQRVAEQVAGSIGSWVFIGAQAVAMMIWVLINSLTFTRVLHFDQYPFVFLNLAMSAEAAFTGPVLLIAANVGAIRDHAQADRIEKLTAQNEQLAEQNCALVERMTAMEQMLDGHVGASLQAHASELRELSALVRAVHAAVTDEPIPTLDALPTLPASTLPTSAVSAETHADGSAAVPAASAEPTPAPQAAPRPAERPTRKRR